MPKNRRKITPGKHRIPIVVADEGDKDDVYDEIDKHHKQYDDELLKLVKQPKIPIAKEILRVDTDDESSEDEFIDERANEGEELQLNGSDKWGRRRHNYYGTSFVDKDFGGVNNSDEEELLQLEEEEALARQKKIEAVNSLVNFEHLINSIPSERNEEGHRFAENCGISEILQIYPKEDKQKETSAELIAQEQRTNNPEGESASEESIENSKSCIPIQNRRKITYEIRKNKGIRKDKGRRKGKQHSRIMKRCQYERALIKRRSQVPDLRREFSKYDGETRGIRISTIRSIKF